METINLKDKSIEQLKAIAYDLIGVIEQTQNNLKIVNMEIANKNKETIKQD